MPEVWFAAGAAASAAVGTLALGRAAQALGVGATAALTGAIGIVLGPCVALLVEGTPPWQFEALVWAFVAAGLSLVGNGAFLAASRVLELALVAPVVATAGALAALMGAIAGASVSASTLVAGVALTAGVVLTARAGASSRVAGRVRRPRLGASLASLSALALGLSYLALGRADREVGGAWAYVALMCLMLVVWTVPRAVRRAPPVPVRWWLVVGLAELSGALVFVLLGRAAAREPVVASLIYSQYAVIAMVASMLVWRDRPSRSGLLGAALAITGGLVILWTAS